MRPRTLTIQAAKKPQAVSNSANLRFNYPQLPKTSSSPAGRCFFLCTANNPALKADQPSLEVPIFSLSTKRDLLIWCWESADGRKKVEVIPSAYGRATMRDKDLLIFATSQLIYASNAGHPLSRTLRFTIYDFLRATQRSVRGEDYHAFRQSLDRLKGTTLKTNIATGGRTFTSAFGILESYQILDSGGGGQPGIVEITLSEWLFSAILAMEVLTLSPAYFAIRRPLERRLYEIARKHVGRQTTWTISLAALASKCGTSTTRLRKFREAVRLASENDRLPDYQLELVNNDSVLFYARDCG